MCTVCGKVYVYEGAHTGEVTRGMMESCQSGEVPRRGTAIRGRCMFVCVCVFAYVEEKERKRETETAVENKKKNLQKNSTRLLLGLAAHQRYWCV